jgi:hypothetical protein
MKVRKNKGFGGGRGFVVVGRMQHLVLFCCIFVFEGGGLDKVLGLFYN